MPLYFSDEPYNKRKHRWVQRNGAIFITTRELLSEGRIYSNDPRNEQPSFLAMPKSRSIDIDDMDDLFMAEALIKAGVLSCKR